MFYNSGFEKSYDELISFYPMFYREVLEMRAILEADGRILDDSAKEIFRVLDNAFIDTADNETIERFEQFLRIMPKAESSYEDRRSNVKAYFTGFGKISASKLKAMLFPFTETETSITFQPADDAGNNILTLTIPRGTKSQISALDIMQLLERRIPAHLWYAVNIVHTVQSNLYFGAIAFFLKEIEISSVAEDVSAIDYLTDENNDILTDELGNILII